MDTVLGKIKENTDKYVLILSQILKVNVEIIDDNCNVISSTEKINTYSTNEAYVYKHVIATGEKKIISEPGNDVICKMCPNKSKCIETFEMHTPIKLDNKLIGVICFSCSEEKQKQYILNNFDALNEFIDQISELISLKAKETIENERALVFIDVLNNVIDKVEQGIIITDKDQKIVKANNLAIRLLNIDEESIRNKSISAGIQMGINQNEYKLTINDNMFTVIGELHNLSNADVEYSTVFMFNDAADFNQRIIKITNTKENVGLKDILGNSDRIVKLKNKVKIIASSSSTVLITGPSGTGKELFARAIHMESNRREYPFVAINCSAIPETLLESELFGYVKGAFTGADPKGKMGKIELANKGILFLDEIGDMPLYIQAKVLRVLEQKKIVRLGSNTTTRVDVRFIAATNKNLKKLIEGKKFREDLFYRLNVIPFSIPALNERKEDIPLLTNFFVMKYSKLFDKSIIGIEEEVWKYLNNYEWPGNVRELENTVEYIINMIEDGGIINSKLLPDSILERDISMPKHLKTINDLEKCIIKNAIVKYGSSYSGKKKSAEELGIGIATLYRKIRKYGLDNSK